MSPVLTQVRTSPPVYQEVYSNSFLRGAFAVPLVRAVFFSLGSALYLLAGLAFLTIPALMIRESATPVLLGACGVLVVAGLAAVFLGFRAQWKVCRTVVQIVRSRRYLLTGHPLASTEGLAGFPVHPDKLQIGDLTFDLFCCGQQSRLRRFGHNTIVRAWYVPTTRALVHIELRRARRLAG